MISVNPLSSIIIFVTKYCLKQLRKSIVGHVATKQLVIWSFGVKFIAKSWYNKIDVACTNLRVLAHPLNQKAPTTTMANQYGF